MNGLTDARLALLVRECELAESASSVVGNSVSSRNATPAGMSRWALYRHRSQSRRALLELTDAQLRDIGLDFQQARTEGMKPFWRE
jgi:uncharacterized protein YjiS (DUF1127 family)